MGAFFKDTRNAHVLPTVIDMAIHLDTAMVISESG